jgi:hypothetical protein
MLLTGEYFPSFCFWETEQLRAINICRSALKACQLYSFRIIFHEEVPTTTLASLKFDDMHIRPLSI